MATKSRKGSRTSTGTSGSVGRSADAPALDCPVQRLVDAAMDHPEGHTGRYIAILREDAEADGEAIMSDSFAATSANSRDFGTRAFSMGEIAGADSLVLNTLGMAVLGGAAADAARERLGRTADTFGIATDQPFVLVPETIEWALIDPASYLTGFRAASDRIAADLLGQPPEVLPDRGPADVSVAASGMTWGLSATRAGASTATGRGIRVAILDTGLDFGHPDFVGRKILAQSFIAGETPQDGNGHGTHVAGTACGPRVPATGGNRYGIAHEAEILIGKVLSNAGAGPGLGIVMGIDWALANGAHVINMSLGSLASAPNVKYTQAGQRALSRGALIVAAAGNENQPTGQPANSPTILSVASVNSFLQKSGFSNFGKVELAAPGSSIDSSLPRPRKRGFLNGTSMAAPHVTGIAALYAQTTGLRGKALWAHLESRAKALSLPAQNQGAGLVQA